MSATTETVLIVGWNVPGYLPDADPVRFDNDWSLASEYLEESAAENGDIDLPTGSMAQALQMQMAQYGNAEYTIGEHCYFITPIPASIDAD